MKFRNFKMIGYVIFGRGAFNQLDEILARREFQPEQVQQFARSSRVSA